MANRSVIRERKRATEQFLRYTFNENLSNKDKKWVRYLWLMGVEWGAIRKLYNLRDATLLGIIRMPENWESLVA
jgi:hypothetical protein